MRRPGSFLATCRGLGPSLRTSHSRPTTQGCAPGSSWRPRRDGALRAAWTSKRSPGAYSAAGAPGALGVLGQRREKAAEAGAGRRAERARRAQRDEHLLLERPDGSGDALRFAERACELNPLLMPAARLHVAQMRTYVGDYEISIRMLQELHRRWPRNVPILSALMNFACSLGFWDAFHAEAAKDVEGFEGRWRSRRAGHDGLLRRGALASDDPAERRRIPLQYMTIALRQARHRLAQRHRGAGHAGVCG